MTDIASSRDAAQPSPVRSMVGAKLFVTLVFWLLGTCFLLSTWLLVNEFRDGMRR